MMSAKPSTNHDASDMSSILLEQADRLFGQHADREVLAAADRGEWPKGLWNAVEEAGLSLALVSEGAGGVGLGGADAARLLRRSAYYSIPVPLGETIIANAIWTEAGGKVAEGSVTLAPANATDRLTIGRVGDGFRLSGSARRVPWAFAAGNMLVYACDEEGSAYVALVPRESLTPAGTARVRNLAYEPRDQVRFDGITLTKDKVLPAPSGLDEGLLRHGAFLRAQQMIGGMERCIDYALVYANERVQFGRPIAKFQAIQHMLAIAVGQFAAGMAAADAAAEAYGTPAFPLAVAVAKARSGEAAGQVAAACHQVHAAMGFTQEHPLHFASRRLWSWRDEFGAEALWQKRIGRLVCHAGGQALWPMIIGETTPSKV